MTQLFLEQITDYVFFIHDNVQQFLRTVASSFLSPLSSRPLTVDVVKSVPSDRLGVGSTGGQTLKV